MSENKEPPITSMVPVEYHFTDDLVTRYANQMACQIGEGMTVFTFFEAPLPLILGTREEQVLKMSKIESLKANSVARIAMPLEKLPQIISGMISVLRQSVPAAYDQLKETLE